MPSVVEGMIRMFADDTKIFSSVNDRESQTQLQRDLEALQDWSGRWQLRFNAGKCKTMHLGRNNSEFEYRMRDGAAEVVLEKTVCERDLGVHVDPSLKFTQHCEKIVSKANRLVGLIRRSFDYIDCQMFSSLFKGLVRPHLEYGNTVWSPLYKKDAILIENVQRRATKLVPELAELDYEDRLRRLNLPSLMYRRLRGDLIEVHKFVRGLYKVSTKNYFERNEEERTRGHRFKLKKQAAHLEIRKHFFGLRVVDAWNSLPEYIVEAETLNSFKRQLEKALEEQQFSTEFPMCPILPKECPGGGASDPWTADRDEDPLQA